MEKQTADVSPKSAVRSPRPCERGESQILIRNTGKHQLHGRYTLGRVYYKRKKKGERKKGRKKSSFDSVLVEKSKFTPVAVQFGPVDNKAGASA